MPEIIIREDLVEVGLQAGNKEQVLRILSDRFLAHDFVTPGYYENVIKREQEFPTGLPTVIPIAICHTEAEYVNQSALAVATLAQPVQFSEMGTPERTVDAQIVFLLALKDPKQQVPWLKKMATLFKSRANLERVQQCKNAAELAQQLQQLFED
jgi:PTS system galactitol-specific IIA component